MSEHSNLNTFSESDDLIWGSYQKNTNDVFQKEVYTHGIMIIISSEWENGGPSSEQMFHVFVQKRIIFIIPSWFDPSSITVPSTDYIFYHLGFFSSSITFSQRFPLLSNSSLRSSTTLSLYGTHHSILLPNVWIALFPLISTLSKLFPTKFLDLHLSTHKQLSSSQQNVEWFEQ